jgi:predicted transposase YbfD/YdcC
LSEISPLRRGNYKEVDNGHGRLEIRSYEACNELSEWIKEEWKGAKTALKVERRREVKGKISVETVYGITSLDISRVNLKKIASYWRGHWLIENKLHYVRDVALGEDKCRIRNGNGSQVLAGLRNVILSLFRLNKVTNVAAELRRLQYYPLEYKRYLYNKL